MDALPKAETHLGRKGPVRIASRIPLGLGQWRREETTRTKGEKPTL